MIVLRERSNLTAREMADLAGVGVSALSQWENGGKRVSIDAAIRITDKFGVTLDWLYKGNTNGLSLTLITDLAKGMSDR